MLNRITTSIVCLTLLLTGAVAHAFDLPSWQSQLKRDHPLTGKLLDAQGVETSRGGLVRTMAKADFVLLGETHDNRDHHALQALIVDAITQLGTKPAIVFEMIPQSMQDRIDAFLSQATPDPAAFDETVEWSERGWGDWDAYQPILEAALRHGIAVYGGDLDAGETRSIGRGGLPSVPEGLRQRYDLEKPLAPDLAARLVDELYYGHCQLMPRDGLAPMVLVQRARDAAMAEAMANARAAGHAPVILIAGAGHGRTDYAIPAMLRERATEARIISLAMLEVATETTADQETVSLYDHVLFTPAAAREDPCDNLRKQMGMGEK